MTLSSLKSISCFALSCAVLAVSTIVAKTPVPEGGIALLPNEAVASGGFWVGNHNGLPVASRELVDADHPDFSNALRVTVTNPSGEFFNGAFQIPASAAVESGDIMFARIFFRSIETTDETGVGVATVFIQAPASLNYKKYITREITAAKDWVEFLLPFEVTDSLATGELSFQVGAGASKKDEVWEIGGIELLNYKKSLTLEELPITRPSYDGRAPDAAWRADAAARIEQHRKGNFRLKVVDNQGAPIPNADVSVDFVRHGYHFGSVIVSSILLGTGSDNDLYRQNFLELFNQSGPENDFKWAPWEGEWGSSFNQAQTLEAMQWLRDRGIYTRGHVMVWPSKRNLPNLIQSYLPEDDPASADPEAKQIVLDHIDDVASKSAAYVDEWDVINEPYDNHYLMDAFGDQVMIDWFAQARGHLPRHSLYLNDYGILSAGGRDFEHQDDFEENIEYLVSNDAPINGIGMQGHFSESPTGIDLVYSILERFHSAFPQLDIRVTEFDVDTSDEEMQADYTRDFLTMAFSHPATVGVQCWGFWAGAHWRPQAAMLDTDWREKPNAAVWKNLTQEVWWNDFSGMTDATGTFSERGFYGDYQATVTVGNESQVFDFNLSRGGPGDITVIFGEPAVEPGENLPALSIERADGDLYIRLNRYDGKDYVIQRSGAFSNWKTILDLKSLTSGVIYDLQFEDENENVFYRLMEK